MQPAVDETDYFFFNFLASFVMKQKTSPDQCAVKFIYTNLVSFKILIKLTNPTHWCCLAHSGPELEDLSGEKINLPPLPESLPPPLPLTKIKYLRKIFFLDAVVEITHHMYPIKTFYLLKKNIL